MSRARNPIPTPRCHKGSAVVDVYHGNKRRTVTLGPWGSPEAEKEFARLLAERSAAPAAPSLSPGGISVAELLLAYLRFAASYYVAPDGKPTKELECMKSAIRPVRELYAALPAKEFGPLALRSVRQRMVDAGLCRGLVNRRTDRVKRVFKWAVAEELVPIATVAAKIG